MTEIDGYVAEGFETVRDEFDRNFERHGEAGAACAAFVDGECVVDLWGGARDASTGSSWNKDTLVLVFSASKGVSAMTLALAHSRGLFRYDSPVSEYWPEFAAHGKGAITVRQLFTHRAGLPYIDAPLTPDLLDDHAALGVLLARQSPKWEPGSRHGYHPLTVGLYQSQLLRRVDPAGRGINDFFQQEIARPLDLEFYFGVPQSVPEERFAALGLRRKRDLLLHINDLPTRHVLARFNPRSLVHRTFDPKSLVPRIRTADDLGKPPYRGVELPAGNGIGQVRSIAKLYGEFAAGGSTLGVDSSTLAELERQPDAPSGGEYDLILKTRTRFGVGMWKPFPEWQFGSDERAYGAPGAGGSFGFADPAARLGFCYAPNVLGLRIWDDPREQALRQAVLRSARLA